MRLMPRPRLTMRQGSIRRAGRARLPRHPRQETQMADGEISLREGLRARGKDDFIALLHDEAPLYKDPSGFWVASRFDDVRAILLDHARFSSAAAFMFMNNASEPAAAIAALTSSTWGRPARKSRGTPKIR